MKQEERRRSWLDRLVVSIVSSRPGASFFRRTMHLVDRPLLRLTRGRLSFASGYPVLLLTTTGAKSGNPRTIPLLYTEWGDGIAIIGTRFGSTRHPGWYHNLRADPEATVEIKGERRTYTAREAEGDERAEIWERAVSMYSGYEKHGPRAGRKIPVMVLTPSTESA
jgi:deazaflavin-dependent oxidoreductase (nitroreductase family)